MSQEPLRLNEVNLNSLSYPKSKLTKNKKIILIKYNNDNFVFQTPTLLNTIKPKCYNNYTELEVALTGKDSYKVDNFIRDINLLEKKIITDAYLNDHSWFDFNNNKTTEINFQKIIRESHDYSCGIIKIKIVNNNNFVTNIQLNNKNININSIPENTWCKMILECYAVWINDNNDFGLFFRPIVISLMDKQHYNYDFIAESSDSNNDDEFIPETEINHYNNDIYLNNYTEERNIISEIIDSVKSDDNLNDIDNFNNIFNTKKTSDEDLHNNESSEYEEKELNNNTYQNKTSEDTSEEDTSQEKVSDE
jgi:hypothetical protein